jgi:hypothetical protein
MKDLIFKSSKGIAMRIWWAIELIAEVTFKIILLLGLFIVGMVYLVGSSAVEGIVEGVKAFFPKIISMAPEVFNECRNTWDVVFHKDK